jgi:polar amino acid transport system substrate-binding protein
MQQLAQKLKNGAMNIVEVPPPALLAGTVLVRNHYSLVSAGTESSTVKSARKGLIGKAKERPAQVRQVIDVLRSQGPVPTYRAVMKKLDTYSPLGYSCAGEVIGVGGDVGEFKVGDRVACGGLTASHAEVVSVPINLCVKLSCEADLRQAAYNTLGAIAMQGVRQADVRLGETCAVLGLGLIGQLTGQLLRAAGVRTIGVDIDPHMVTVAASNGFVMALARDTEGIEDRIMRFAGGFGCDAVIITAGSGSLDPINFAGAVSRKRGIVVVVGAVPTGFDREPHFYKKELQVRMSCSYGPGRYDPQYEEKGIDYPPAYVRWTEKRNMQAFQDLITGNRIDISFLTTHTFKLEDAPAAYDMMMAKSEPFIGILIEYRAARVSAHESIKGAGTRNAAQSETKEGGKATSKVLVNLSSREPRDAASPQPVQIGFIGAGSYAQSHLLPNLPKSEEILRTGVMTATGTSSRSVAERFGFEFCTSDAADIIDDPYINTVFIATRHDSHADYVLKALRAGKHVFVEKPLCVTEEQLEEISSFFNLQPATRSPQPILMVGYNRRFSPLARAVKEAFGDGPMAIHCRINAGAIPPDSWIQDPLIGGGRIIGEVCHFVDLLAFFCGSRPVTVHAAAMTDPHHRCDTVCATITYANGAVGSIGYFANGYKSLSKERVEVFAHDATAVLEDFKRLTICANGKTKDRKLLSQDKGQKNEVQAFLNAVREGKEPPIQYAALFNTSAVTFKILASIQTGQVLRIE